MQNKLRLILGKLIIQTLLVVLTSAAESCVSPKQEAGQCVVLNSCEPLYNMLLNPSITQEDKNFLAKSQCGYKNNQVFVCCVKQKKISGKKATLPQPPVCGKASLVSYIVGGNITALEEYPWMALIEYTRPGGVKSFHCGGALISDRYVLSAAHCYLSVPSDYKITGVRLGEWDTTTNPDCITDFRGKKDCAPEPINVPVEKIVAHPDYDPRKRTNLHDIALLRLSRKVPFSDFVAPVCLPSSTHSTVFTQLKMDAAGWGKTETGENSKQKLKASLFGWDFDDCKRVYASERYDLQPTQLCAGGATGIDTCSGDSGGPLVALEKVSNRDAYVMLGIVSFGTKKCGSAGWPGVYTIVSKYIDWIQETMEE